MIMQYEAVLADLAVDLGLEKLPEGHREELLAEMGEVLLKRIFVETMEKLAEGGDSGEYERFMESRPTQEEAEKFLSERIPGYADTISKIAEAFKNEMKQEILLVTQSHSE
jgi:hypothetical protein